MENKSYQKHVWQAGAIALLCVSFASVAFGLNNLSERKHPGGQVASITVSGEGEATALPDIATITFTVRESAKTVPEAQKMVEAKISKVVSDVTALGVDKKDTKTLSYTVNPKYEAQQVLCVSSICPPARTIVVGYEVSESIMIKVRKIDKAGEVIGLVGKNEVTEVSGPDFTVDDMDKAQAEAKDKAIVKAQEKAKKTADSLGVSLGGITQFSEDNGGYYPVMYKAMDAMSVSAAPGVGAATLPQGESVIKSHVTITYLLK